MDEDLIMHMVLEYISRFVDDAEVAEVAEVRVEITRRVVCAALIPVCLVAWTVWLGFSANALQPLPVRCYTLSQHRGSLWVRIETSTMEPPHQDPASYD
ncbi:hypothetical protein BU25DRAFT_163131 [Macroventuria anomochaeta]|uniref:Uncharacterized protein n=1 Tax=Macroventuria anomochaeta TaxID=301207 RepID=A0ACB6RQG1_9PLEO|nr:uncharacterized protein BU25DRAFT_163131 [Macroventuria anomochaeta]KAF2624195.1 hypothetical protein BU25DRAFT_163131 [Macroventuria anomochaeta]